MTMTRARLAAACVVAGAIAALGGTRGDAHKPITSPYTYNEDVFPVLRDRCGRCHVVDGIAPMSLMTHAETVPWGESIKTELLGGHMPPWNVDGPPGRFRNVVGLSARELNVLLTWATGGTPAGDTSKAAALVVPDRGWRLGEPDLALPLPSPFTLAAGQQEATTEFTLPAGGTAARWVRAVDVLPGTPAMVRGAVVSVKSASGAAALAGETVLGMWLPGDDPIALDEGAFRLPAGAELVVRVHYKKTWQHEQTAMTDRSTIGVYFAREPATEVRALRLAADARASGAAPPDTRNGGQRLSFSRTLDEGVRAVAVYPDPSTANVGVTITAVRPDGSREELIAFRPRAGWARRYWFAQPVGLPRGTRLEVTATANDELSPPGAAPLAPMTLDASSVRLTLNVLPL